MSRHASPPPPEFLIDRSLGSVVLPAALAARGFTVHTLRSVYGEARAQEIQDEEWLAQAGRRGWIVLAKDERIRRRPAELAAIQATGAKAFYLTAGGLRGDAQVEIFLMHINRITQRAAGRGPMIWAVTRAGIRRVI